MMWWYVEFCDFWFLWFCGDGRVCKYVMVYDGLFDFIFFFLVWLILWVIVLLIIKNVKMEEFNVDNEVFVYYLGCVLKGMEWVLYFIIVYYYDYLLMVCLFFDLLNIWMWLFEIWRGLLERIFLGILNVIGLFFLLFKNVMVIGIWLYRKLIWFYLFCVYFVCINVCKLCNYIWLLFSFWGV